MRWDVDVPQPKRRPQIGDTRTVKKFAFWPTRVDHDTRKVWLEWYDAHQRAYEATILVPESRMRYTTVRWTTDRRSSCKR